jgi:uncharacterized membrane protein YbjE (DUF340 family)
MKGSLILIGWFVVGALWGHTHWLPAGLPVHELSFYALAALIFVVGFQMGHDPESWQRFRALSPGLLLLPVMTILGTWAGVLAVHLMLPVRPVADHLAIGSGFAYYSLSSLLITNARGAEAGTVALLCNIFREMITLVGAPLMVRYFGLLAPISAGGATTMDTTLPILTRCCGPSLVPVALYHGFVVDFSVPFLVNAFCAMG